MNNLKNQTGLFSVNSIEEIKEDLLKEDLPIKLVYGVFLYTDEDLELSNYIKNNLDSLNMAAKTWGRFYVFEKPDKNIISLKRNWKNLLLNFSFLSGKKVFDKNQSYDLARELKIPLEYIPCLAILRKDNINIFGKLIILPEKEISPLFFRGMFETLKAKKG